MSSPTTTIALTPGSEQVALVNVFTVEPRRQDELVDALERATTDLFVTVPGFLSANLHTSLDGARVVNYAQWASEAAFGAALAREDVRAHMAECAAIAESYDPTLVQVRVIHHAKDD